MMIVYILMIELVENVFPVIYFIYEWILWLYIFTRAVKIMQDETPYNSDDDGG